MRGYLKIIAVLVLFCMFISYNHRLGLESIVVSGFSAIFVLLLAMQCED